MRITFIGLDLDWEEIAETIIAGLVGFIIGFAITAAIIMTHVGLIRW